MACYWDAGMWLYLFHQLASRDILEEMFMSFQSCGRGPSDLFAISVELCFVS